MCSVKLPNMPSWVYGLGGLTALGIILNILKEEPGTLVAGFTNGVPMPILVIPVGNDQWMRRDAGQAFRDLQAAAKQAGLALVATSGFRSMMDQTKLYTGYKLGLPGFNLAAAPGYSNHQGGISVDIGGIGSFSSTAYRWMKANARTFGFVNDVASEYWHWTYKA